jgi:hypothetical protein
LYIPELSSPFTEVNAKGDGDVIPLMPIPYHINVRTMELALVVVSDWPEQLSQSLVEPKPDRTTPLVDVPEVSTTIPARAALDDELAEKLMV